MPEVRLIDANAFLEQYGNYYAEEGTAEGFIGTVGELQGADLGYLYRYLSKFIGRPAYTHELPAIAERYKEEIKEDFLTLCRNAVDTQLKGGEPDAG